PNYCACPTRWKGRLCGLGATRPPIRGNGSTGPKAILPKPRKHCPRSIPKTYASTPNKRSRKPIKAVFLQRGLKFPHIHDLAQLLTGVGKGRCQNPKICTKRRGIDSFCS